MARIFLCHASEDKVQVRDVYQRLAALQGFEPWLDEEDLFPGHRICFDASSSCASTLLLAPL
jgi:hypothetical protein